MPSYDEWLKIQIGEMIEWFPIDRPVMEAAHATLKRMLPLAIKVRGGGFGQAVFREEFNQLAVESLHDLIWVHAAELRLAIHLIAAMDAFMEEGTTLLVEDILTPFLAKTTGPRVFPTPGEEPVAPAREAAIAEEDDFDLFMIRRRERLIAEVLEAEGRQDEIEVAVEWGKMLNLH